MPAGSFFYLDNTGEHDLVAAPYGWYNQGSDPAGSWSDAGSRCADYSVTEGALLETSTY